ncbi:hypothetical protein A3F07_04735 [candidate division WWE3 bacterium RIFCSPHIGHO2_12_FULL_38_15]|uniref:Uncharacterized protein n=1 Tax=candidate division WWE3 bacterium RIFCSPHIGHO2_02_FULL_38_14 TaxID=1802620 RepID=A0A1F4V9G6_UNCKA|nr:MAG: hypothetical protein A2793_00365 [candidate division WWE3 bacterium RIFCSPHIGHO2_01_FULL_38_45]OGC49547.1 MAG: hypothetical protein A3F07_04735 [candidate division WWE3 bacterium RIFCSPHIGHO2_12_FULL_38_15]OGC52473.1 MAG: hypothetical protein A3B64_02675 [candidate division WWE3 bacterium RIFCSPLOWO2_01_FULL_37_24]OGC53303.1 MAG: hypothetical protein A3D91_02730 [candidate division WWE3 bacterium RIFCSPHIGHO2_02_FULL_38_14]HLB51812.1 hypothetical protein [Patescibacteria group bacterium
MKKPVLLLIALLVLGTVAAFLYTQLNPQVSLNQVGNQLYVYDENTNTGDSAFSNKITSPTPSVTVNEEKVVDPANLDPALFVMDITNKYLKLPVGRKLIYEGQTEDGLEKVEITIPGDRKLIIGVNTLVYVDKVWVDAELVESTKDYLAQDINGNVWYFGEDVDNYEDGVLKDHEGAWLAGVNGAQPGIWIKAEEKVGDKYRQEYAKDVAEDSREILAVNQKVTIGLGTYNDCVKTYDWTPLDPEANEHKFYCSEVGALVKEIDLTNNDNIELKSAN